MILKIKRRSILLRLLLVLTILAFTRFPVFSQNSAYYLQTGQNYLRSGEFIKALEYLNDAILKEPFIPELYYLRGYAKYSLDDYYGAEQDFSRCLEISPYQLDVLINRAEVRSQQSDFSGALEDLTVALKLDSANAQIYFDLARIKLYLKKYYAAMADCNKAIQLGYKNENAYILKGSSESALERYDNAIADFKKAIEINPSNPNAFIQLGSLWLDRDQYDSTITYLDHAIRLDSLNLYALFNRSLARIKKSDKKGGLDDLDRVIKLSPYNSYAYFNRAIIYVDMNEKKKAIRNFDYVIRLNPKNVISYYYRGMLKAELKDYQGSLNDLDKTIELLPDSPDAFYQRYQVKLKLNDRSGAMKDYRQALDLAKKNKLPSDSLASGGKNYLKSLVKLSGDFEEMNTVNSKFQNQYVEVQLLPMFRIFPGKAPYDLIGLYDSYEKPHYNSSILTLTRHSELITDSLCRREIRILDQMIDSSINLKESMTLRALCYAYLRNFNPAFHEYDSVLHVDSNFVLAYFDRAVSRYDLIRLIHSLDDYQEEITIGKKQSGLRNQILTSDPQDTYENVVHDLTRVLELDPDFSFAYYNRGFAYCQMGEYRKAADDFSKAISFRADFPEAYYNRGLIRLLQGETHQGCADLSRAGELGILDAYKVMKRYCYKDIPDN